MGAGDDPDYGDGFFAAPPSGPPAGAPPPSDTPLPGRTTSQPVPSPVPKPAPQGTGYGPIAIGLGALALLAAIFVPLAWYLISVGVAGAGLLAWPTFRRSVDTGAPGKEQALIAFGLAALAIVVMFVGVARDRDAADDLAGLRGSLESLGYGHLAPALEFGAVQGIGVAEVAFGDTSGSVPVHCGVSDDDPQVRLGAIGQGVTAGQGIAVGLAEATAGTPRQVVLVRLGATTYHLAGDAVIAISGENARATGTFTEVEGTRTIDGSVAIACLGFGFG